MRKEYTTPVMECEEFVTNEYCALCYTIRNSRGSMELKLSAAPTAACQRNDGVADDLYSNNGTWYYTGDSTTLGRKRNTNHTTGGFHKHDTYTLSGAPVKTNAS